MRKIKAIGFLFVALVVSAWIINQYMIVKTRNLIFRGEQEIPAVQAVVVPGASVYRSGKLSPVLKQRMDAATHFLQSHHGLKLVLSGHAVPNGYNETVAMAEFARKNSVPSEDILTDEKGRSTFVTMLHCRREFGLKKILVVSQDYHLARALYIAQGMGLEAYGLAVEEESDTSGIHFREYAGRFKDFILLKIAKYFHAN